MAQDVLQADYEKLTEIVQMFSRSMETISQMDGSIKQHFEGLIGNWEGEGWSAFYNQMNSTCLPAIQRLGDALASGHQVTQAVAQLIRDSEEEASKVFHNTSDSNDFGPGNGVEHAHEEGNGHGHGGGGEEGGSESDPKNAGPALGRFQNMLDQMFGGGGGGEESGDVKDQIRNALSGMGYDADQINEIIANASPEEREAIWSDSTLMSEIQAEMGTDNYLDFVVAVEMNHSGRIDHTSARDADAAIQDHLADYVDEGVADGRGITGRVAIVDDTHWDIAGIERYGEEVWNGGKRDGINGFVDAEGRVWIHEDKGNPGTMIHEATHKYSDDAMIHVSQPLNEGVTEYFTRSTTEDLGLPDRNNYQGNYEFVSSLSTLVGEDVVAEAYFNGNMDGLEQAYIASGHTQAEWDTMIEHTKNNEWEDAEALSLPVVTPTPKPTPSTPTPTPTGTPTPSAGGN